MFPFLFRIFSFDERRNKFCLLSQSHYLKRCVLTISHVIDVCTSGKPLVMLFAGDTAGKISCWDITSLLLNHIRECCDLTCKEDRLMKLQAGNDEETVDKEDKKTALQGHVSLEKCATSVESVTAWDSEDNVASNSEKQVEHEKNSDANILSRGCWKGEVAKDCVTDCHVNESVTNAVKHLTERTGKAFDLDPVEEIQDPFFSGQDVFNETNTNEQTAIMNEKLGQTRSTDQDEQGANAMLVDQSDFSCLPLVPVFLDLPMHVFQAHQSGVNAIALVKTQGKANGSSRSCNN